MSLSVGEEDEHGVQPTAQDSEGLFGKRGVGHKQKIFIFFSSNIPTTRMIDPIMIGYTQWVKQNM